MYKMGILQSETTIDQVDHILNTMPISRHVHQMQMEPKQLNSNHEKKEKNNTNLHIAGNLIICKKNSITYCFHLFNFSQSITFRIEGSHVFGFLSVERPDLYLMLQGGIIILIKE